MSRWKLLLAIIAGARGAIAHDHHGDNIPEGQAISLEPIVGDVL